MVYASLERHIKTNFKGQNRYKWHRVDTSIEKEASIWEKNKKLLKTCGSEIFFFKWPDKHA